MSDHCVFVDDDADIRQGDVIRRFCENSSGRETWGFIITADCDIAQKKTGDKFTWLEIIKSEDYLESHWVAEQLRRVVARQSTIAAECLNGLMKCSGLDLAPITPSSLCSWLADSTAEDILKNVNTPQKTPDPKMVERVQALRIALGYEGSSSQIARLRQAWTLLGRDEKTQQAAIREAFDLERGFPDHLLVPEIPNTNGYGFVILLRSISSVHSSDLFKTEVDAKINDRPDAFGRFSDSLRFSVAQKLAFLFSRIGMSSEFEEACEAATDLLIDSVYAKSGE
jgi:hypothetical protein